MRKISGKFKNLPSSDIQELIKSPYHEERSIAIQILVYQFPKNPKIIYDFYLKNTKFINNWDLVDISAPKIVGEYLLDKPQDILFKLVKSNNLWERRIAILSTFAFIYPPSQKTPIVRSGMNAKNSASEGFQVPDEAQGEKTRPSGRRYFYKGDPQPTLQISKLLLKDKHDLIHKAVGWMLREVGKRCGEKTLTEFLDLYCLSMSRTALRYAIERLPESKRKYYLNLR
jgi:3-methyladenine DNA glycosylase AlkD